MVFPAYPDIGATVARLALGLLFLPHGWPKIKDIKATASWVKGTGWPGGATFAVLFSLLEFFGAIAVLLGFLTQIVAALFALEMVATTIFAKTKLGKKYIGGYEMDIAFLLIALVVVLLGPGPWSLDRLLGFA
jgi:putative oxidoreductase